MAIEWNGVEIIVTRTTKVAAKGYPFCYRTRTERQVPASSLTPEDKVAADSVSMDVHKFVHKELGRRMCCCKCQCNKGKVL